ncbi:hypothetical protein [Polyangium sp. y55x31]|uniref:hypothetical protein n=1 Tax=Polyangium sp. y55x31 TaxID=3042688 RepID=UPI00248265AA|nr:hypothetical protein [Polyangium sp. y55x31]MDI1484203.1 hypothetical protein [Polyangium sp. y55x31]
MMTRRAAQAWALGLFLSMVTVTGGCYIEHGNGSWDDDWSDGSGEYGPAGICFDMCNHLAGCGTIDESAVPGCIDGCNAQHASTPYLVETGSICVIEAGCVEALNDYDCPGAPLSIIPGNDGAGGYSSSGNGYGTGGSPAPSGGAGGYGTGGNGAGGEGGYAQVECTADCDCPSGSSCIDGACKVACVASCECPTGQSCVGGYCEAPPAPQIPCQVDCDCPSGQVCSAGACVSD